jgi:hypothetical protein
MTCDVLSPLSSVGMVTGILLEVASIELRFAHLTRKYRTIRDFLFKKNWENNSEVIHIDPALYPTNVTYTSQPIYSAITWSQSIINGSITLFIFQRVYERHLDQTEISIFLLTAVEWIDLLCDFARDPTPITTYKRVPTCMDNTQIHNGFSILIII